MNSNRSIFDQRSSTWKKSTAFLIQDELPVSGDHVPQNVFGSLHPGIAGLGLQGRDLDLDAEGGQNFGKAQSRCRRQGSFFIWRSQATVRRLLLLLLSRDGLKSF